MRTQDNRKRFKPKSMFIFLVLFIIINIPLYIYRWYWFGTIDYIRSEKTYAINGIEINLPWGWYNPYIEYEQSKYPISFINYNNDTVAIYDDISNEETIKRLNDIVEDYISGNRKLCLTGTIYKDNAYMFVVENRKNIRAYIYIIDIGLEIYLISDKPISYYQFGRRAGAIIKNIRIDESKITVPFYLSEDKERALQNICMPIIKWGNAKECEELDQAEDIDLFNEAK